MIREFDRATLRGGTLAALEHLVGVRSTFHTADEPGAHLGETGFDATATDRGFACAVAGAKPGGP